THRECRYAYHYTSDGHLSEEIAADRNGVTVWTFHRTTLTAGYFTDERGFPQARAGSGAAYVEFVWSPEGWPQEIWYLDRAGQRGPDSHNVYGRRFRHDARGLPTEIVFLGPTGQPILHKGEGHAQEKRSYDDQGNRLDSDHFDVKGQPVLVRNGFHRYS